MLRGFGATPELLSFLREWINTTPAVLLAAAYSKQLADTAFAVYRDDFEVFGYARESWMFLGNG